MTSETSVAIHTSLSKFTELVMAPLMQYEAENQVILGMLNNPGALPSPFELMMSVHRDEKVVGAATKNLGLEYKLIVSPLAASDCEALAVAVNEHLASPLIGVLAINDTAESFAKAWSNLRNATHKILFRQGVYTCSEVTVTPNAVGSMKLATMDDILTIVAWRKLFISECGLEPESDVDAELRTERAIRNSWLVVWVESNRIVSMLSAAPGTPNGGRIGLVYTPPSFRGKGYASACVAAATKRFFERGKTLSFLYTDLSNPISNKIYERVGYVRVADSLDIRFDRTDATRSSG